MHGNKLSEECWNTNWIQRQVMTANKYRHCDNSCDHCKLSTCGSTGSA